MSNSLTAEQQREENAWQDIPNAYDTDDARHQDILHSRTAVDISHAGKAMADEGEDAGQTLLDELHAHHNKLFPCWRDGRTHQDHVQKLIDGFAKQMERMTDAYMEWSLATAECGLAEPYAPPEDAVVEELREVYIVDLFSASYAHVPVLANDAFIMSTYMCQGLIPVAPFFPSTVITIRTLEVFRTLSLRCPHLGIQAFVRTMCDLDGTVLRPSLPKQFSIAFNAYLTIRAAVDNCVKAALGHNTPDWRLKNACPACLYKLEGEADIPLPFLATINGNNSLKHFWRRERDTDLADGMTAPGASKERQDNWWAGGDYYLPRDEVDKWAKEGLDELMKEFVPGSDLEDEGDSCTKQWQNMREEVTSRVYGNSIAKKDIIAPQSRWNCEL
ncbi:hypothetical protein K438DRAFT_1960955 [Mycena galopus ATCC 62051]|nr:hypothetical protein K438DRAFT_1960955 [Mycena galopus ATCC 62051]